MISGEVIKTDVKLAEYLGMSRGSSIGCRKWKILYIKNVIGRIISKLI